MAILSIQHKPIMSVRQSLLLLVTATVFLLSQCAAPVAGQCDLTKGCYPEKFSIFENIASFPDRTINASSTCGENSPEGSQYRNLILSDLSEYTCLASTVAVSNMVDVENNPLTFWQSETMVKTAGAAPVTQYVEIHFNDEFLFYELQIKFAVPHGATPDDSEDARPAAWTVEKRTSQGTWVPLHHFAKRCADSFPNVPILNSIPSMAVECAQYDPPENGFYDDDNWRDYYPGQLDVFRDVYKNDTAVADYFTTTGIRLVFLEPAESSIPLASYVTISDLIINVVCKCNGHASACTGANQATCDCQHATTGQHCDQCLALYNNRLPMAGTTSNAGACQVCNCNEHADSCQFDSDKNIGVCQGCRDNTAGDSCQDCATGFYTNTTWQSEGEYCLGCQCDTAGTLATDLTTCNGVDGQCTCKTNVMLRDCSECKDGFYGLEVDVVEGCSPCACNQDGTLGDGNLCTKTNGACLCRKNVAGTTCDQCKPLTYDFNPANPEGCTLCNCDPGASINLACDVTSGQCQCHANIEGRDCRQPANGFFVPKMDLIRIEPEISGASENVILRAGHGTSGTQVSGRGLLSLTSQNGFQTTFSSEYSGLMDMVIQFEKNAGSPFILVEGSLAVSGNGYTCGDVTVDNDAIWIVNSPVTEDNQRVSAVVKEGLCINKGSSYTLSLTNSGAIYAIDSIIFVPVLASMEAAVVNRIDSVQIKTCRDGAISTLRPDREACSAIEYSVMSAWLNGAVACSCSTGSRVDSSCDPMSGDCNCMTGVLSPLCEVCKTDFYNFLPTSGCTACGCNENGSENQYCSNDGVCQCRRNVAGTKCDSCQDDYFGLYTGLGCDQCHCNGDYSQGTTCMDNGQCQCKPGVGGLKCDACGPGNYELTIDGCKACQCEPLGSTEESCNHVTGECECRANVQGQNCDQCKNDYYGLGPWNDGGCIPCFCWDRGINCTALKGYGSVPLIAGGSTANFNGWTAVAKDGTEIPVTQSASPSNGQIILSIAPGGETGQPIYYNAPPSFHGDRTSAYGRYLRVAMTPSVAVPSGNASIHILFEGQYWDNSIAFTYQFDVTQTIQKTLEIPIRENSWMLMNNGTIERAVTYKELMAVLFGVSALKIQAKTPDIDVVFELNSVSLDNAQETQGEEINNIESCNCQNGYTGNRCQRCASGYTRLDPISDHPSDQCVTCQCNGHASDPCNPVSGVCSCVHNTEGDHCNVCVSGYYGDATRGTADDCLPCACPGNVPAKETNVFAQTCVLNEQNNPVCDGCQVGHHGDRCELCVEGYFGTPENVTNAGGSCQLCACNGRADTCDTRTGECIGCQQNTTGHSCEICGAGFYGDAMADGCQECVCKSLIGSTGQCDPQNGDCECLPNVHQAQCDQCEDLNFNLVAGKGCEPCNCFTDGSINLVCDKESGQCPCRPLVQGRQCNECQASFWNINMNADNGCDACECNATGTAKEDNVLLTSCDLYTGQCQCAQPGIIGRQCDVCSPVSTFEFDYVKLLYLGLFPQCELCGECFDSWGQIIDELGTEIHSLYSNSANIWSKYDNQTSEAIGTALTFMQENINSANESLVRFARITQDLQTLAEKYSQTIARNGRIDSKTNLLSVTQSTLETNFATIDALTESINLAGESSTTLTTLDSQMNMLKSRIEESFQRGTSSWEQIESLSFVVAPPEERERQLLQQVQKSMATARIANNTLVLANILYETSLTIGVNFSERELTNAQAKAINARSIYVTIQSVGVNVIQNITSIENALGALASGSETARARMLQYVEELQGHMTNATSSQVKATTVELIVESFTEVTKQAEMTVTNAMLSILENAAKLNQAQTDMIKSQVMSTSVLNKQFRSSADLQAIIDVIRQTSVSSDDVEGLNLKAQKALFEAETALTETQQALGLAREVKQEVELMEQDIQNARNLQVQAQGIRKAAIQEKDDITAGIEQANTHISQTQQDISTLTTSAQVIQDDTKALSSCLTQMEISVGTSTESANRVGNRVQSASTARDTLLQVMVNINEETNDQSSSPTLVTMTTAKTLLDQLVEEATNIINITSIDDLLQDLVSQNSQIISLETTIDQLESEVDQLLVNLKESVGLDSCSNS